MKHKTLLDIARLAGVSPSTVSRALRNHPDINKNTIKKIKQIAARNNFSPNPIAQGLKTNTTSTIGVIVPEITHDFFATAISGIEEVIYKSGYTLLLCQSNESSEMESLNIDLLLNHRVAGIIASISESTLNGTHFKKVLKRKTPLVFFDRVCTDIAADKVIIDDEKGAFDAVSFLLAKGYKRIAHLKGPDNLSNCSQRYKGYVKALGKKGIKPEKSLIISGGMNEIDGYNSMAKILKMKKRPDAIFAVNDPVAIGAFQKIREEGLAVPRDIAIVGFSNNIITSLITPGITTIAQPSFEMGKTAASVLIERIRKGNKGENKIIVLDTQLIIRDSA